MNGDLNTYWNVDVYLGIILKYGILQDLPFMPFVWKAFAEPYG
jgi:hypothetical protein